MSDDETLVQLHWQNRFPNHSQAIFVAQTPDTFASPAELHAWANEIINRRCSEMPEGWMPMLCTQDSEHFVLAAKEATRDA